MSYELSIYKQNRIKNLIIIANNSIYKLYINVIKNIRNIQRSRLRNKQVLINNEIIKYNNNVNNIKQFLNLEINNVNSFQPEFVIDKNTIRNKKALLIGINYLNTEYQLNGCIDDTNRIKELLSTYGFNDFNIITDLTDTKPNKENILNELQNMIINSVAGDILFLYFSGHGSYTYDMNNDETDKRDEMIISLDFQAVLDDELKNIISKNIKKDVTIVALFDSCHSGTMLDLKYNYLDSNNYDNYSENNNVTECVGNVIMISGCMDNQTSTEAFIDNKPQGVLTRCFIDSLNNNPNSSWREIVKYMRNIIKENNFTQIPQLSTDSIYDIDSKIFL